MLLTHDVKLLRQGLHLTLDIESLTSVITRVLLGHLLDHEALVGDDLPIARSGVNLQTLQENKSIYKLNFKVGTDRTGDQGSDRI